MRPGPARQTWEDPQQTHPETKAQGDNDPLDVCEIGEQVGYVGQVKQVKVLGIMALLDEGETDWKVIVIDVRDPLASRMNDIEDVERQLPANANASCSCPPTSTSLRVAESYFALKALNPVNGIFQKWSLCDTDCLRH